MGLAADAASAGAAKAIVAVLSSGLAAALHGPAVVAAAELVLEESGGGHD